MLIGTGGIFVFEQIVRKALAKAGLKLPSSLVSMVAAFILLKVSIALLVVVISAFYTGVPKAEHSSCQRLQNSDQSPTARRHPERVPRSRNHDHNHLATAQTILR